jgi:hypothetical protein
MWTVLMIKLPLIIWLSFRYRSAKTASDVWGAGSIPSCGKRSKIYAIGWNVKDYRFHT